MESHNFRREDNPPLRARLTEIRKIGPDERLEVFCMSPRPQGYWTHWHNGRSVPCFEPRESCGLCAKDVNLKWTGYLFVYETHSHKSWFIELTEFAKRQLDVFYVNHESLRGCKLLLYRARPHKRAPLKISVVATEIPPSFSLTPDREVLPTLLRVWGLEKTHGRQDVPTVK